VMLTRFNVRRGESAAGVIVSIAWLEERLKIFAEVTIPSILAQTRRPHFWLVFFDAETPEDFKRSVNAVVGSHSWIRWSYCKVIDSKVLKTAIDPLLPSACNWLLTTRLDNDDALNPALIEQIQSAAEVGRREFLNPRQGLVFAFGKVYKKNDYSSPFITLSESVSGFKTVWLDQHQRLSRHGPIRQIALKHAWIQLVHGGNIANQVRGVRMHSGSVPVEILPKWLAQQLVPNNGLELLLDNTIGLVRRYFGSALRRLRREVADRLN